jgi:hypothetical protein
MEIPGFPAVWLPLPLSTERSQTFMMLCKWFRYLTGSSASANTSGNETFDLNDVSFWELLIDNGSGWAVSFSTPQPPWRGTLYW